MKSSPTLSSRSSRWLWMSSLLVLAGCSDLLGIDRFDDQGIRGGTPPIDGDDPSAQGADPDDDLTGALMWWSAFGEAGMDDATAVASSMPASPNADHHMSAPVRSSSGSAPCAEGSSPSMGGVPPRIPWSSKRSIPSKSLHPANTRSDDIQSHREDLEESVGDDFIKCAPCASKL